MPNFTTESPSVAAQRQEYESLSASTAAEVTSIKSEAPAVDVGALVSEFNDRFETMKGMLTDSAMASVQRAGADLDAYLGSAGSDQRTAARIRLATTAKNSIMQSAFQEISKLWYDHAKNLTTVTLEGEGLNVTERGNDAASIRDLYATQANLFGTVSSAISSDNVARLNASVEWAKAESKRKTDQQQIDLAAIKTHVYGNTRVSINTLTGERKQFDFAPIWPASSNRYDSGPSLISGIR